jgi:hypothetical protein
VQGTPPGSLTPHSPFKFVAKSARGETYFSVEVLRDFGIEVRPLRSPPVRASWWYVGGVSAP